MKYILSLQNLIILTLISFTFQSINSQNFTDSNLPIVIIETDNGETIPNDPRIFATMKIIQRPDGSRNFVTDASNEDFLDYSGSISIERRGFSSQLIPKKPYGFTTLSDDRTENDNVKLLGMPKENDWILNAFAYDDSMMRDFISYGLSRKIGQYAVNLQYCEVVLNGDYIGLYALSEKIKRDGDRVDIAKLDDDENTFPEVTGGYIMQTDRVDDGEEFAWSSNNAGYIHEKPNEDDITTEQSAYIESVFTDLDVVAQNPDIINGYPSVIDIPAFVDYMLLAEIASNVDTYEFSTYYHKDRGGKLRAGPVWDYNLAYGNDLFDLGLFRSLTDVWQFSNGDNEGADFWKDLFNDSQFNCYLSKRFDELTSAGEPLNYDSVVADIDSTVALISEAVLREDERWDTIDDFSGEISDMKIWIQQRITWMQNNLGDFSTCNMVATPSLVITKINYHPEETDTFPESDDLEFIEIQNTDSEIIDLTGIYLSKLGVSYQFPVNSTISVGESIYLAGDGSTFLAKYGSEPFDTFTRDLSNKRQNLVLADAFGNVIDEVEYLDDAPWPEEADGDGFYLELIDVSLDNSLASSWVAVSESVLNINDFNTDKVALNVHPNPTNGKLIINAEQVIQKITIFNIVGQQVKALEVNFNSGEIDISELYAGAYFFNFKLMNGVSISKKVFKK